MSRHALTVVALLLSAALSLGCAAEGPPSASPGGPVTDRASLVERLRDEGATIEDEGEITQPFFSVAGSVIAVYGEDVQVFEYESAASAENEAAEVSPDGSSVGTTMISWVAPPHFYRTGRIIVLYVGDSATIVDLLESVLGVQFAGQ